MAERKHLLQALDILTLGASGARKPRGVAFAAMEAVHVEARPWSMHESIQGMGIAEKITDGERLDEKVLKVYIDRKLPRGQCEHPVPRKVELPGTDVSIDTDVEEIGKVELEVFTGRTRPAAPGSSVAHPDVPAGTFGCLVRKKGQSAPLYILSNSHVLANEGVAKVGDPILQPGPHDDGEAPGDVIAKLTEWIPFDFSDEGYPNLVDAAIAEVPADMVDAAIRLIGVPTGVSTYVRTDMQVQKTGRTTDYTLGKIKDIDHRTALSYKRQGGGKSMARFRDQVLCTRYTAGGDSGSAVLNMSGKVVGLHFAGSPSTSIFNRIQHVIELLGLELVAEAPQD